MNHDLEFLPVGNGEKSGDAIVIRWQDSTGYKVGVIDGGTLASGEAIVEHIKEHYGDVEVEFALNTHPDCDHCSGLSVVLDNLKVKTLWMHLPWDYSSDLIEFIEDDRVSDESLEKRIKEKLGTAYEVFKKAKRKGIKVCEPFQGEKIGPFTVLSPSRDWYIEKLSQFRVMPAAKTLNESFLSKAGAALRSIIDEKFDIEMLKEGGSTSPENETSAILFGNLGGKKVLLTGDAGIEALTEAADYADANIAGWKDLSLVQIPHHGSRRNVAPSILDRILGSKVSNGVKKGTAYVSASKDSKTHPRKMVTNAFMRRGYTCYATQGYAKRSYKGTGERVGWSAATPLPFYDQVEDYD
jgi:beta-lactamase superfamily II metal-dependent hydrolase